VQFYFCEMANYIYSNQIKTQYGFIFKKQFSKQKFSPHVKLIFVPISNSLVKSAGNEWVLAALPAGCIDFAEKFITLVTIRLQQQDLMGPRASADSARGAVFTQSTTGECMCALCYHALGRSPGCVVHKHARENRSDATNRPAAAGPKCLHNQRSTHTYTHMHAAIFVDFVSCVPPI
jgi:hypothetical protein